MKKLMICLLGLPLALSGCVSDEEMAAPRSLGAQYMDRVRESERNQGLSCSLAVATAALGTAEDSAAVSASGC
jgi:hypothetical protein